MAQSTIRTFFACELSSANLAKVTQLLNSLKNNLPRSIKWVNPKNMHLTIKFIGAFNPAHLEPMQTSLKSALQHFKPFQLEIKHMGIFPSRSQPKVVWLGIEAGKPLSNLVTIVNHEANQFGYEPEKRPFSAHITLGRVKSYASRDDLDSICTAVEAQKDIYIGSQTVKQLLFIKSDLTRNGPRYETLIKIPFSG